ncbi:MAG TPA: M24 family metallopeptidase [Solirubrobacteraceae bacterium]|jgi:Xaa-Pro aminopeptidase
MRTLLLYGDTEHSPALRHEIPLTIIDPLLFVEQDGRRFVLTSHLESARVAATLPEAQILDYLDFGFRDLRRNGLSFAEAEREVVARVVEHLAIATAVVPSEFPVGIADRLRADGVELVLDDPSVLVRRRSKRGAELEGVRAAQRSAEAGMKAAAALLARAEPGPEGRLRVDGQELLAEDVRDALRSACAASGAPCPPDVLVSTVWGDGGHDPGSGPLPAGLPIQVDLWPQHEASGCWADMTRTFVVGTPSPKHSELIAQQEELVAAALQDSFALVKPGVTGQEPFDAVCDRFEAAGFRTQRTGAGENPSEGFQFSLGHGVGLEIHEAPTLGIGDRDRLVAGDVLAIEPGLWDERIGGVRFEDLVLVTDDGYELLTHHPYGLDPAG